MSETFRIGRSDDVAVLTEFNIAMAVLGLGLYFWASRRDVPVPVTEASQAGLEFGHQDSPGIGRRIVFVALLLFSLIMPSDWTQDVPARYGKRHPGMVHSAIYPEIPERKPDL